MDEIEREELLKRYEDAVRKAQEEYENAVEPNIYVSDADSNKGHQLLVALFADIEENRRVIVVRSLGHRKNVYK